MQTEMRTGLLLKMYYVEIQNQRADKWNTRKICFVGQGCDEEDYYRSNMKEEEEESCMNIVDKCQILRSRFSVFHRRQTEA